MAPSPTIRRLLKETKELSASAAHPNPAFHAAPISDNNLHEWHFTLLGPPAPSPYAGGIYHGRITLPPAYPMKPPNFRFLTPSGRFEVNREICLSISGFHEETWQPAWGVRTALVALRGFMGEEGTAGQVGGLESTREIREKLARQSRGWSCPNCGGHEEGDNMKGWTNEERLNWWWELCREKGVNVEAECEGMEALPDGMKVETREVKLLEDKGKQRASDAPSDNDPQQVISKQEHNNLSTSKEPEATTKSSLPTMSLATASVTSSEAFSDSVSHPSNVGNNNTNDVARPPRGTATQVQQPAPVIISSQPIQLQPAPQQTESPITIDRAITVVFLALFIMILKKMFYPSASSLLVYDDLRLMRE